MTMGFVETTVTWGQMLGFIITVLGCLIAFVVSVNVRLKALEIHKENQEKEMHDLKINGRLVLEKLDNLSNGITDIKIKLENKQNRKDT